MVGVEFEARGLRRRLDRARRLAPPSEARVIVQAVGPGAAFLPGLAPSFAAIRPDAVVVTGVAGGCAPGLVPGELIVGDTVGPTAEGAWLSSDPRLVARATRALEAARLPSRTGRLLTVTDVVATPAVKAECWRVHAALAVEMESARVVAWANGIGLPVLAVRAVADGPTDPLPSALLRAVGAEGALRPGALLRGIAHPALWGAAWRVWRRSRTALDRLARFLSVFTATPDEL